MSAYRHPHNATVRPIEEELAEMGLNPTKVLSEIDRNTAMLEGSPTPFDLSGLQEGDTSPRSIAQYSNTLLAEKCQKHSESNCKKCKDDPEVDYDGDDGYEGMDESESHFRLSEALRLSAKSAEDKAIAKIANQIVKGIKAGKLVDYTDDLGVEGFGGGSVELKYRGRMGHLKLQISVPWDTDKIAVGTYGSLPKHSYTNINQLIKDANTYLTSIPTRGGVPRFQGTTFRHEGIDADDLQYLLDEGWELDEAAFGVVKKAKGAAARLAKRLRHREYLKVRGARKLAAKIYRKKFKRKIKRRMTQKLRKYGRKGLAKLHRMGKRVVQKSWSDQISNIYEELEQSTAPITEDNHDITEDEDIELSPAVEALLNAAETAMYLGEIFDAMGDNAGEILFQLSDKAVDLADSVEENEDGEPTEAQEGHIQTILEAVIKALAEHEERGAPSLGEAIGVKMVIEGKGEWDELVEGQWTPPHVRSMKLKGRGVAMDQSVAAKYLKAINMAMQKQDASAAMKTADTIIKKHKVFDVKGIPVKSISTMTDVLRVMFFLSQITGLKAPAWMYKGKRKPWFVHPDEAEPGDPNFDPNRKKTVTGGDVKRLAKDDDALKSAMGALFPGMFSGAKAS